MASIYVITNTINNKQYVGKTNFNVEKRFKEHLQDSFKNCSENRPLYKAIRKYGKENFSVEVLEECSIEESYEREIFWIKEKNTYLNGYNATIGGDGKTLYDYSQIAEKYMELKNLQDIAKYFNCSVDTVANACKEQKISVINAPMASKIKNGEKVNQIDINTQEKLASYNLIKDAARAMVAQEKTTSFNGTKTHISEVCRGKRKTCCGYKWSFE